MVVGRWRGGDGRRRIVRRRDIVAGKRIHGIGPRSLSLACWHLEAVTRSRGTRLLPPTFARELSKGVSLFLRCRKLLVELCVLLAQLVVLFLQPLGDILESNIPFDLSLLVLLNPHLQFCELRLFPLTESPLGGSESDISI